MFQPIDKVVEVVKRICQRCWRTSGLAMIGILLMRDSKIDHNLVCCDDKDIEEEMKTMDNISMMLILLIMIVTILCCCYCC